MHVGTRVLALLAVGLLALPVATAQIQTDLKNPNASTPTSLYFHIFDTFNAFPINTQQMNTSFFEVGGTSFPSIASQGYDFNTIYGFSTSGPVEYDFIENGRPRFHPERGIAADVQIDPAVQPYVFLYLDVRDFISSDSGGCFDPAPICGAPQFLPQFTMRATMREGNEIGTDLDAGNPIMAGELTAHIYDTHIAGAPPPPVTDANVPILTPDAEGIVEFKIPMTVVQNFIPKSDSFNIRVDWYQDPSNADGSGGQQEDQFAEGWVRLVSTATHSPRLEMSILNPVYISFIHPQVAAGILLIHMGVNSPWGTYDVDVANITVNVDGPDAPEELELVVSQNSHVHGLHDKDAEITYLWRFREEKAENGDYAINVAVPNNAKSATATGTAGFILEGQKAFGIAEDGEVVTSTDTGSGGKDSPSAPVMLGALAVLGAALLLRRRGA